MFYPQQIVELNSGDIALIVDELNNDSLKVMPLYSHFDTTILDKLHSDLNTNISQFLKRNFQGEIFIKFTAVQNTSSDLFFQLLPKVSNSYDICEIDNLRCVLIRKSQVKKVYDPLNITSNLIRNNMLDATFIKLIDLLNLKLTSTGIYGSKLIPKLADAEYLYDGNFTRDYDLMIYGDEVSKVIAQSIKELIKVCEYQYFAYKGIHHRLFNLNGEKIDILFTPSNKWSYGIKKVVSLNHITNYKDKIVDDSSSMFYPSVYGLQSGLKLVSYNQGHKMQYSNECKINYTGLIARVVNYWGEEEEVLLVEQFRDWFDFSADQIYLGNEQRSFISNKQTKAL